MLQWLLVIFLLCECARPFPHHHHHRWLPPNSHRLHHHNQYPIPYLGPTPTRTIITSRGGAPLNLITTPTHASFHAKRVTRPHTLTKKRNTAFLSPQQHTFNTITKKSEEGKTRLRAEGGGFGVLSSPRTLQGAEKGRRWRPESIRETKNLKRTSGRDPGTGRWTSTAKDRATQDGLSVLSSPRTLRGADEDRRWRTKGLLLPRVKKQKGVWQRGGKLGTHRRSAVGVGEGMLRRLQMTSSLPSFSSSSSSLLRPWTVGNGGRGRGTTLLGRRQHPRGAPAEYAYYGPGEQHGAYLLQQAGGRVIRVTYAADHRGFRPKFRSFSGDAELNTFLKRQKHHHHSPGDDDSFHFVPGLSSILPLDDKFLNGEDGDEDRFFNDPAPATTTTTCTTTTTTTTRPPPTTTMRAKTTITPSTSADDVSTPPMDDSSLTTVITNTPFTTLPFKDATITSPQDFPTNTSTTPTDIITTITASPEEASPPPATTTALPIPGLITTNQTEVLATSTPSGIVLALSEGVGDETVITLPDNATPGTTIATIASVVTSTSNGDVTAGDVPLTTPQDITTNTAGNGDDFNPITTTTTISSSSNDTQTSNINTTTPPPTTTPSTISADDITTTSTPSTSTTSTLNDVDITTTASDNTSPLPLTTTAATTTNGVTVTTSTPNTTIKNDTSIDLTDTPTTPNEVSNTTTETITEDTTA